MNEIDVTDPPVPAGFHPVASGSGLLVPEAEAREREVWTRDEWRLIDRVLKLMRQRQLAVTLHCNDPRCQGAELSVLQAPVNGFTWRCDHKDRVFHRQI